MIMIDPRRTVHGNDEALDARNQPYRLEAVALQLPRQILLHRAPFLRRQRPPGQYVAKQPRGVGFYHPACQTGNARLRLDSRRFATILHTQK